MNFAVARIVRLYERHPQPAASFLDVRESVPRTVSSCQLIEFPFGTTTRRRKPDNLIGPPHGDHTPCEIHQLFDSEQWVLPELMAELETRPIEGAAELCNLRAIHHGGAPGSYDRHECTGLEG
jgi:hypothetical protein